MRLFDIPLKSLATANGTKNTNIFDKVRRERRNVQAGSFSLL